MCENGEVESTTRVASAPWRRRIEMCMLIMLCNTESKLQNDKSCISTHCKELTLREPLPTPEAIEHISVRSLVVNEYRRHTFGKKNIAMSTSARAKFSIKDKHSSIFWKHSRMPTNTVGVIRQT